MPLQIVNDGRNGVLLSVKVVPGADRDEIVGPLGDRLKVRVSAPPEGGKANKAVCELIAAALGVKSRDVELVEGASNPRKVVRIAGVAAETVRATLESE